MEGLFETVAANGHHFCAHSNANINTSRGNLVRNVLCSLETGGAESVDCGGSGGIREACCESCRSELVRSFTVRDLGMKGLAEGRGRSVEERDNAKTHIATADILDELRVDFGLLDNLLEQRIDEVVELSIFESTLEAFGKRCSNCESNHYIVGILGGAAMNVGMCHADVQRGSLH